MKMATKYGWVIPITALAMTFAACTSETEEQAPKPKGTRAYAEVTLDHSVTVETRANKNTDDNWSVSTFSGGDVVGMYADGGVQNPENLEDFSKSVTNVPMYYEGSSNSKYKFGNSDYVLDPAAVSNNFSIMYYPYYKDMPDPKETELLRGRTLRDKDIKDGIEKCIDFMYTNGTTIKVTDNVMQPTFVHLCVNLILERGEGFKNATCKNIWVVMKKPCTDIRIRHTTDKSQYYYYLQYMHGDGETEDNLKINLMDEVRKYDASAEGDFYVNKYAVWESWEGKNSDAAQASRYVIIPPGSASYLKVNEGLTSQFGEVYFILIQDDNGIWQRVSDFYLSSPGLRYGAGNYRYRVTIALEGVKVVARPALISWENEIDITDEHKVGIESFKDFNEWAQTYNLYTSKNREETGDDDETIQKLRKYGDTQKNDDSRKWYFYINNDIEFPANATDFVFVDRLDDSLEGTSTIKNYEILNIHRTLFNTIGEGGSLRALDFRNIHFVQPTTEYVQAPEDTEPTIQQVTAPFAALTMVLDGGTIDQCRVINSSLVSQNPVGMLAGEVTSKGCTVKNCNVSGQIVGSSTAEGYHGLFGVVNALTAMTVENNKYDALIFGSY